MKKLFFVLLLLFLGGAGAFWWYYQKPEQKTLPGEAFRRAALNIHTRWLKGDDEGQWREGKLTCEGVLGMPKDTHPGYLRCNPNFLYCWYRYQNETVFHGGRSYSFKVHFPSGEGGRPFTRREGALLAEIEGDGGTRFKISLLDTCSEVWLPHGHYGYGQYSSQEEDWRWDNRGRNIFVDKFLVSKRDIWEWGRSEPMASAADFPAPATGLSLEEMKDYCAWRGKGLMEAHVFDAAAFYPGDTENLVPVVNIRGHYPWTSERMVLEESENFSPGICLRFLDQECFEREGHQNFSNRSMSWTGMNQVLGGIMEAQRNPIHPNKNLMLSSFYYSYYSPAHHLGRRGRWYGKGAAYSDFNFRGLSPQVEADTYKVGFRCMREAGKFAPIVLDTPNAGFSYASSLEYEEKIGGAILSEPRGIWHRILKAGKQCLFYKTPFKKGGAIRMGEDCSNAYSNELLYSEVKNFQVDYGAFQTVLTFETNKKERLEFVHFNVQRDLPSKRYDSPVNKSYRTGLLMGGWPVAMGKRGSPEDNYRDGTARICHQVDQDCGSVVAYSCDRCRYGFFEVADFKCPQGGTKYCGRNRCGELGQPACLRGFQANSVQGARCEDDWNAGFCRHGLRRVCDTNGVLVCSQ